LKFYIISSNRNRVYDELERIGVDPYSMRMADKGELLNIVITDLKPIQANVIKQESLASGMDTAVNRGVISASINCSDIMIMGTINHYERLLKRLKHQKAILKELPEKLDNFIRSQKEDYFITKGDKISVKKPLLMGIVNCTPDSFSNQQHLLTDKSIKIKIEAMLEESADIIDIGGVSSRPNADTIPYTVEIERISYALKVAGEYKALISVDTNNYQTAKYAITHGAKIINDIDGLLDDNMAKLVSDSKVAIIIMHKQGSSKEMQQMTDYQNLFNSIKRYFSERIEKALKHGIDKKNILIDLGFGFSKTYEQNLALLKYMQEFKSFGLPIVSGISNKSMIGIATNRPVEQRLYGTVSADTIAILNGADIIRSHNIRAARDSINFSSAILDI